MSRAHLNYTVAGPDDGPTVVFIHGWPDSGEMWIHQVAELSASYRCVCVTLPNFADTPDTAGGYEFSELVEMLRATIDLVQPVETKVNLVTHDWGAYIGYLFEKTYPERVGRMVALDIGGHSQPKGIKELVFLVGYQWTLIAAWLLGGLIPPLGNALSRGLARVMKLSDGRIRRIRSYFNYPYFRLWMDLLLPWRRQNLLKRYVPQCQVLFIYGGNKPLMFHSERWLHTLKRTGGRHECIEDGDHWFMESHPQIVNGFIHEWLSEARSDVVHPE